MGMKKGAEPLLTRLQPADLSTGTGASGREEGQRVRGVLELAT